MNQGNQLASHPLSSTRGASFRSSLRSWARERLPEAMVPSRFVVLPELPKLPNGKVDRASLPEPDAEESGQDSHVAPRTATESRLAQVWQDLLGLPRVGVESSFFDLGGNSLTVLQMTSRVREEFGVRLDLRHFFDSPTVAQLARMVGPQAELAPDASGNPRGIDASAMVEEATLPDDIGPRPHAHSPAQPPYRRVLLTGGTGYTGAFLLRELLDRSSADVRVLARAADEAEATRRVLRTLETYGLLRGGDEDRVGGVPGDTGRPYLGLTPSAYEELATGVEMIVHNAAVSSWTLPYAQAKPVNVLGTLEVLRLAGDSRVKPVHFISSTGVYPGHPGRERWPERPLSVAERVVGGYRQSKWVADSLVTAARARGIPTHVYRPGAITGAAETGVCSTDTFINDLIKGSVQLGAAFRYELMLELVPVDYCAAAVAHIALQGVHETGVFNVPGAEPVPMDSVIDMIVDWGYPLRRLPYARWCAEFTAAVERGEENRLTPYLPLFASDRPAEEIGHEGSVPELEVSNLRAALRGSGISAPPVDRALIDRYLSYFVSIGHLPPPQEAQAERKAE